ncbi:MAG: ATP phosphoribosyltransferase regulatory subunit [Blastocatellia bacterium]|nr:ATP phosphoribosyltransferase regulatory subunit [Blastocatellia bacterium]
MNQRVSKIPHGVRYFFGQEVAHRRDIEQKLLAIFNGWSYQEIALPIFDYHELFALGIGQEAAEQTYRFFDHEGELLALRPDLTSLVARTVATRFASQHRPIRLCYSGEVFRYKQVQKYRPHDFHQLGLEHIGNDRLEADVEVIMIVVEVLNSLGIAGFKLTLSQVDLFNGIADNLELSREARKLFRTLLDSRNSEQVEQFLSKFAPTEEATQFTALTRISGKNEIIQAARKVVTNSKSRAALEDLEGIIDIAQALNIDQYIDIDLGDVNGLDYYTGMTFKIYVEGVGSAIGSGGRYDNLLQSFGLSDPAVGFQLSLDWLSQIVAIPEKEPEEVKLLLASDRLSKVFEEAQAFRKEQKKLKITNHLPLE